MNDNFKSNIEKAYKIISDEYNPMCSKLDSQMLTKDELHYLCHMHSAMEDLVKVLIRANSGE